MTTQYDALIVGAGPAGCQCARDLSKAGFKVLLIDKAGDVFENNYSSGGAPIDIMEQFSLPDSVVGTYWNTLRIHSTKIESVWTSPSPFGPILDFDKLKTFLAADATKYGCEYRLCTQYQNHQNFSDCVEVYLKDLNNSSIFPVRASVVIDATGSERKVLAKHSYEKQQAVVATGIEYHINVKEEIYKKYSNAMNFFLGHHWMPQGYAWIFPMANPGLKVGVIRYFQNKTYVPYQPSYKIYLNRLLQLCEEFEIVDRHGKTIHYTEKQRDLRVQGRIIAIGDAISSINPLGWEGIRHAMQSGQFAAQSIQDYLSGKSPDLNGYNNSLNKYFGKKWFFSEKFIHHLFRAKKDAYIDQSVAAFSMMDKVQIIQVIFQYKFRHTLKSYFWYYLTRLINMIRNI